MPDANGRSRGWTIGFGPRRVNWESSPVRHEDSFHFEVRHTPQTTFPKSRNESEIATTYPKPHHVSEMTT
jgi:hypothetical protein